jgi:DNA-binding response OmpR family regulator
MKILLVDNDQEVCQSLIRDLEYDGITVDRVHTGEECLELGFLHNYDALVLDIILPGINGLETLTELRKTSNIPVVILSAKSDDMDRIVGIEMGADDYLHKPCHPRELSARLRGIQRRTKNTMRPRISSTKTGVIQVDELEIDYSQHQVKKNDEVIELTVTEYNILNELVSNIDKVLEKNQLAQGAMSRSLTVFDRSLDMHLSNLRKKIGAHQNGQIRIKTIRGVGYMYASVQK